MKYAVVTGSTGFVGSHFILHIDETKYDGCFLIVRGESDEKRRQKVKSALRDAASAYMEDIDIENILSRLIIMQGDITLHNAGVSDCDIEKIMKAGDIDIWHFAASLNFEDEAEANVQKQNMEGTSNIVDMSERICARHLFYVSTAYTCGLQGGMVDEHLHEGRFGFSNYYEKSKAQAERYLVEQCENRKIDFTIFRPSIVVGHSLTKRPGGGWSGLYGFIRSIHRLKRPLLNTLEDVRIDARYNCAPNFVPVDFIISEMIAVHDNPVERIYHLTAEAGVTIGFIIETIAEQLEISNITVGEYDPDDGSPLEELLHKKTKIYSSYLKNDREFIRKRKTLCSVSEESIRGFIIEGIKSISKKDINSVFSKKCIENNGQMLNVYTAGATSKEAVILINANGMPAEFMAPLAKKMSKNRFVVTWESRLLPSSGSDICEVVGDIGAHLADMEAVMDRLKIDTADVVGWCSGAGVALASGLTEIGRRVKKIALLNGAYLHTDVTPTGFEKNINTIMPKVANDYLYAEMVFNSIFKSRSDAKNFEEKNAAKSTSSLLSSTDPDLVHLTSIPFQSPDNLYRYGQLVDGYLKSFPEKVSNFKHEVLFATGSRDITTSPESSKKMAEKIEGSQFIQIDGGDHFMVYNRSKCHEAIEIFLSEGGV
ncbi:alpha/beta fold hydrolase [Alcanivorax sp.]|uniref:alpha/beta fold hydrolase n=1 Tax=Alcanivorax sp. TaxID=1872427 RepID=UPI002B273DC7|nr:alpha/beta fold hydrolase [Alcanivorax sp.]